VTRLTDFAPDQAKCLAELECPDFETRLWVIGPALSIPPAVALGVLVRGGAQTDHAGNHVGGRAFIRRLGRFRLRVRLPLGCAPLHGGVVHGRQLDRDDSGTGRSATPAAMVRKDHRSGGFDASESCQCVA
jgi:hypothetical protein